MSKFIQTLFFILRFFISSKQKYFLYLNFSTLPTKHKREKLKSLLSSLNFLFSQLNGPQGLRGGNLLRPIVIDNLLPPFCPRLIGPN